MKEITKNESLNMKHSVQFMKDAITKKVAESYKIFNDAKDMNIPLIPIKFTLRGTTAGQHQSTKDMFGGLEPLNLNFNLFIADTNWDEFLATTVPHEVAHHCANEYINGDAGHGRAWSMAMSVMGIEARRCHNYDIANLPNRVQAKCGCMTHNITKTRANKMKRGHGYGCGRCGQPLELV